MLRLESFKGIYLHRGYVDFRKSVNGLSMIVEEEMGRSPMSGDLFVFCNRRRDKLKLLYWDSSGFALWYKRLEEEKFSWPKHMAEEVVNLRVDELEFLLTGYRYWELKPHKKLDYVAVN